MLKESIFRALVAFVGAIVLSLFPAQSGYAQNGREGEGDQSSSPTAALLPDPLPLNWCLERAQQSNPAIAADEAAAAAAA